MIIETLTWGSLDIKEDQVYRFEKGIPGFDEEAEFALIEHEAPFVYLQSTKEKGLAFLLGDPFAFYPDYEFVLPEADKDELNLGLHVKVLGMITLREQIEQSTMNLLAPIVLNSELRLGKQVVLHQTTYQTKHPLWPQHSSPQINGKAGE